jgi:hypothetical protein
MMHSWRVTVAPDANTMPGNVIISHSLSISTTENDAAVRYECHSEGSERFAETIRLRRCDVGPDAAIAVVTSGWTRRSKIQLSVFARRGSLPL